MLDDTILSIDDAQGEVFEGPEKKLEVFFSSPASADGFRQFGQSTWSDLLVEASCTILHCKQNAHFDAYLLSESSMFVYPSKVILKTCGTTGLLLVLPKLLALAERIGVVVENVHYGHYRYKFPEQQLYPHASLDQERSYLSRHFGSVQSRVLGPTDGRCWFALCARPEKPLPEVQQAPAESMVKALESAPEPVSPGSPRAGEDIFEIAMEGLHPDVCRRFVGSAYPTLSGKALATHMTAVSGIGALLPKVLVDEWAFEPCGYSMNGLRNEFYYTIHITPEEGFSYASFETNDPKYRQLSWVQAVVAVFAPAVFTATLTTRHVACELPSYTLPGFERTCMEVACLGAGVSVCSMNFSADATAIRKRKLVATEKHAEPIDSSDGPDLEEPASVAASDGSDLAVSEGSDLAASDGSDLEGSDLLAAPDGLESSECAAGAMLAAA